MKHVLIITALGMAIAGCQRHDDGPPVGLLEMFPVMGPDMTVKARPTYILTDKKLATRTVFTGLHDGGGNDLRTLCCYEVVQLEPVSMPGELTKYAYDDEFVSHMKSIRGYAYVYHARPAPRALWNDFMATITQVAHDPRDGSPYWIPVIGATIREKSLRQPFDLDGEKTSLTTTYAKDAYAATHRFTYGTKTTTFAEAIPYME